MKDDSVSPRITVAEAIDRLGKLVAASEAGKKIHGVEVYLEVARDENGEEYFVPDGLFHLDPVPVSNVVKGRLRSSLVNFSRSTGIRLRNMIDPWATDSYTGEGGMEDWEHDISMDEFERWAAGFETVPPTSSAGNVGPQAEPEAGKLQSKLKARTSVKPTFSYAIIAGNSRQNSLRTELARLMDEIEKGGTTITGWAAVIPRIKPGGMIVSIDSESLVFKQTEDSDAEWISSRALQERIKSIIEAREALIGAH